MTREVRISICGLQKGPEMDGEPIETVVTGEYFVKNGKQYLLYEEYADGVDRPTKNRIKLCPGRMELSKSGPLSAQMVFEEGQKYMSQYMTPYGSFLMGIDTKKMIVKETENQIDISVKYVLEMNEEFVADCDITICVKSQ